MRPIRTLPWGEEIYEEVAIHPSGSSDKCYVRHGKTPDGREYIEVSKFGPKPNTDGENYMQKFRAYSAKDWKDVKREMNRLAIEVFHEV